MTAITDAQVTAYVQGHIGTFHEKRLEGLSHLKLSDLLINKNPYLFRCKNLLRVSDLVQSLLDAHLSSQEETMFGDFLEGLAVYIAGQVHGRMKSGITGIDLEFTKNSARYIVSIKSGPNWGNSSQIEKMKGDFRAATRVLTQRNSTLNVMSVNGCCYGRDSNPNKGGYFKYCGQEFWQLISNDRDLFTRIIEPLGHNAKKRNEAFRTSYDAVINRFANEFTVQFCNEDGAIDWDKLVRYSSAATPLLHLPVTKRDLVRVRAVENAIDLLIQWGYSILAEEIEAFAASEVTAEDDYQREIGSLRGLLMFLGNVQSDGVATASQNTSRLISLRWDYGDARSAEITFLDVDRVAVTATRSDGEVVAIRNSQRVQRKTAAQKLVDAGLFIRL